MIKSISTGSPAKASIPLDSKTKKLIKETAKLFIDLKTRADKVTCLPHFKLQIDFFSQEGEEVFFKEAGKILVAKVKPKKLKKK